MQGVAPRLQACFRASPNSVAAIDYLRSCIDPAHHGRELLLRDFPDARIKADQVLAEEKDGAIRLRAHEEEPVSVQPAICILIKMPASIGLPGKQASPPDVRRSGARPNLTV